MSVGLRPKAGRLLCHCLGVTFGEVEETIREHACKNADQVTKLCKAGGGCRSCVPDIEQLIEKAKQERRAQKRGFFSRLFSSKDVQ